MPYDPTKDTRVTLPDGTVKVYPAGTPLQLIQQEIRQAQGQRPLPPGMQLPGTRLETPIEPGNATGEEMAALGLNTLAVGSGFIPGPGWGATAARIGIPMALDAGAELLRGKDPTSALTWDAGMGTGSEVFSRLLPKGLTALALGTGGIRDAGLSVMDATKAFVDDASTRLFPRLPGRRNDAGKIVEAVLPGSRRGLREAGHQVEAAELANPSTRPLTDMAVPSPNTTTRTPLTREQGFLDFNNETFTQLAIDKQIAPHMPNASPQELMSVWNGDDIPRFVRENEFNDVMAPLQQPIPGQRRIKNGMNWRQPRLTGDVLKAEKVGNPTPRMVEIPEKLRQQLIKQRQQEWIEATEFSMREIGELQRGESKAAQSIINARKQGSFVPEGSNLKGEIAEDFMKNQREWRHDPANDVGVKQSGLQTWFGSTPKPGQAGSVKAADEVSSRLHKMDEANKQMRGMFSSLGTMATRAAIPATAAYSYGLDPTMVMLAGALGLSPEVLSGTGIWAGRAARFAPTAIRGTETVDRAKKEVRRRGL